MNRPMAAGRLAQMRRAWARTPRCCARSATGRQAAACTTSASVRRMAAAVSARGPSSCACLSISHSLRASTRTPPSIRPARSVVATSASSGSARRTCPAPASWFPTPSSSDSSPPTARSVTRSVSAGAMFAGRGSSDEPCSSSPPPSG